MAGQITWRNLTAPDFTASATMMGNAGKAFDKALTGLKAIGADAQATADYNFQQGQQNLVNSLYQGGIDQFRQGSNLNEVLRLAGNQGNAQNLMPEQIQSLKDSLTGAYQSANQLTDTQGDTLTNMQTWHAMELANTERDHQIQLDNFRRKEMPNRLTELVDKADPIGTRGIGDVVSSHPKDVWFPTVNNIAGEDLRKNLMTLATSEEFKDLPFVLFKEALNVGSTHGNFNDKKRTSVEDIRKHLTQIQQEFNKEKDAQLRYDQLNATLQARRDRQKLSRDELYQQIQRAWKAQNVKNQ